MRRNILYLMLFSLILTGCVKDIKNFNPFASKQTEISQEATKKTANSVNMKESKNAQVDAEKTKLQSQSAGTVAGGAVGFGLGYLATQLTGVELRGIGAVAGMYAGSLFGDKYAQYVIQEKGKILLKNQSIEGLYEEIKNLDRHLKQDMEKLDNAIIHLNTMKARLNKDKKNYEAEKIKYDEEKIKTIEMSIELQKEIAALEAREMVYKEKQAETLGTNVMVSESALTNHVAYKEAYSKSASRLKAHLEE